MQAPPDQPKMEKLHFHFEFFYIFLHPFWDFYIFPTSFRWILQNFESHTFTIRRILQLANDKGPIGEFIGLTNQVVLHILQ